LQLDTWIVIHPDNTATFFVGKTDGGQGTGTAFRQMMCDELDIAYDKTRLVMGRTDTTPDQGGSGGSDAIERGRLADAPGGRRRAARAARARVEHLHTPVASSRCATPGSRRKSDAKKSVTYAELVGGKRFDVALTGRNVDATTARRRSSPSRKCASSVSPFSATTSPRRSTAR